MLHGSRIGLIALALVAVAATHLSAQEAYQTPPQVLARLVDAPQTPAASLSPERDLLLLMDRPALSSIERLAEPELRLAGLRINPANSGPSRAATYDGLTIVTLSGARTPVSGLPEAPRIRDARWSPDGRHVAFLLDRPERVELHVVPVTTGEARRVVDLAVNDVASGTPFRWVDESTLIVMAVPEGRGSAPERPAAPAGPVIQDHPGGEAPARTYQDLLQDPHDEAVFAHFMASQLTRVTLDGVATALGEPSLFVEADPSPDGRYLLVRRIHEPFSYLVPYYRFPESIEVWDEEGGVIQVAALPLAEDVPTAFGSVRTGAREVEWRGDADATLIWAEALDGGDAHAEVDARDAVMMLAEPFDGQAIEIVRLPLRFTGVGWTEDGRALVNETWWSTRIRRAYVVDPTRPGPAPEPIIDVSTEDRYRHPGFPLTRRTESGHEVLLSLDGGSSVIMSGEGASPEGNRPFLRRLDLSSGAVDELFRSEAPYYETPLAVLDDDGSTVLTRRESVDSPPNFFVRGLDSGSATAVTDLPHPYPELAAIKKEPLSYAREDGVQLSATLYLPPGYDAARDGPLPALVWAYPREFKSADAAGQRSDSPHRFTQVSYWGAIPYVTQGYAVIDNASMPVVGEGEAEPNDTFRDQLVANARAAIEEGVRRGVVDPDRVGIGGHSYGAFMTGNLLAHSDLFRAGIARSGAYNRTLTPFGFQREERLFWEAPEIYFYMSPFMHADKVNEPILLIHGQADNNSGTFPMQSERFFNALKGLGATARLVMLPHESHGYRARESILHLLWETNRWLELHVKNAAPREGRVTEDPPVS
jgi:dipeptidyl aminopeptidase/acylaminoacyl peptidase